MAIICAATETSTAPPAAFFARWADMETWPDWDEAILWARLDGPFAAGTTGVLKPRGGPKVRFVIEVVTPGCEFTDVSSLLGARLRIRHLASVMGDGRTRIDIEVSIDGPLGRVWGRILGRGIATSTPMGLRRLVEVTEAGPAVGR
jgi:hypothetical protein